MMASRSSLLVGHLFCFSSPCVWRFRLNRLGGRSAGYFQFYLFLQLSAKTWWANKSIDLQELAAISTDWHWHWLKWMHLLFLWSATLPRAETEMNLPRMACIKTSYLLYNALDFLHVFSTSLTFTNKRFTPEQTQAKAGMQRWESEKISQEGE